MSKGISIAVVGNCQARPLAHTISMLLPNVTISGIAIVHLLHDSEEEKHAPIFESSDLILAQRVTDNYPCKFVRSMELRHKYGDRVTTWPNLYYGGYNPELVYLRGQGRKPLGGPLGDYHNKTFLQAWRDGLTVDESLRRHTDLEYNRKAYCDILEKSFLELRARENETDVCITDWIEPRLWHQRLFFVFNHPTYALIEELARRLLSSRGIVTDVKGTVGTMQQEPLGQLRCPVNPWVASSFCCSFGETGDYLGLEIDIAEHGIKTGKRRIYGATELVEAYFRVYERFALD